MSAKPGASSDRSRWTKADWPAHGHELNRKLRAAFLEEWDPIGVRDVPEAQDEYDAYVTAVFKLLTEGSGAEKIFEYLWWVETVHMGLQGDRQKTSRFAERLAQMATKLKSQKSDIN